MAMYLSVTHLAFSEEGPKGDFVGAKIRIYRQLHKVATKFFNKILKHFAVGGYLIIISEWYSIEGIKKK